jgi:hypothetical protein
MTAKTEFHASCTLAIDNESGDSAALQALYATYLKALNYGADKALYSGLIYTNRYLKAEFTEDREDQFVESVGIFSEDLKSYVTTTDEAERKRAHKAIIVAFGNTELFYPLQRTVPVVVADFTIGVNEDATRFATIIASAPIALDGQNVTLV